MCKTKFFLFLLSTPLSLSADPTTLPAHHIFHFQILISLPSENKQKILSIQIIYKKVPFNSQLYITRRLQYADLSSGIFAFEGSIYSVILRIFALNPHFWLNWHTSADQLLMLHSSKNLHLMRLNVFQKENSCIVLLKRIIETFPATFLYISFS